MAILLHINPTPLDTARAFADFWLEEMKNQQETQFSVALSGGSTPKLLFQVLAEDYSSQYDWARLHLFWGDERCVPHAHPESNYGMTQQMLLSRVPELPAGQVHAIECSEQPELEADRYDQLLRDFLPASADGWPRLDLVMLGLGEDGHTASLFPDRPDLWTSDRAAVAVRHPESGQSRISLTLPVINQADVVAFLVTGEAKARRVADIIKSEGDYRRFPAAQVQPRSGQLHWFLDEAAASLL